MRLFAVVVAFAASSVAGAAACSGGDAGPAPAPSDASTSEASVADAVAADADAESAAPRPTCATLRPKPTFCRDFEVGAPGEGWTGSSAAPGTALDVDPTDAVSGTRSLLVKAPASATTDSTYAYVKQTFTFAPRQARIAFDVRLGERPVVDLDIVNLDVGTPPYDHTLSFIATASGGAALREAVPVPDAGPTYPPQHVLGAAKLPSGRWIRVEIDVFYGTSAGTSTAAVAIDGVVVEQGVRLAAPPDLRDAAALVVGLSYAKGPYDAISIRFDDVSLTAL